MLINHMEYNKIDIMLLQEHNIREIGKINKELNDKYQIIINLAIHHKGGTAILLNRKLVARLRKHWSIKSFGAMNGENYKFA